MAPTNGGVIQGIFADKLWTSTAYVGINIQNDGLSTIHDIYIDRWFATNCQHQGMLIDGAINVDIGAPRVWSNSQAAANTYSGIKIQSSTAVGTNSIKIRGGKIGGAEGGLSTEHLYNVEFGTGFTGTFNMNETDIATYGTSPTGGVGVPGGGSSILQCPGYNPIGVSTGTAGSSGQVFNGGYSGGTYYFRQASGFDAYITIGGHTIGYCVSANAALEVQLGPTEQCTLNYSTVAPTYVFMQH
jgi:hypothetical protein